MLTAVAQREPKLALYVDHDSLIRYWSTSEVDSYWTRFPHLALGAIHCHSAIAWDVRQPRRKDVLALTVHSRAPAESADLEFFQLARGKDGSHEAGQSGLLNGARHLKRRNE